jgi:D-amino peptidase
MFRQLAAGLGLVALIAAPGVPQPRPLKVLVLYDMEGVTGATSVRHTSYDGKADYEEARQSLTADVNAAVAGLKAGGAAEITIVDGHGSGNTTGPDVLVEQLVAPAKMISRDRPFDIYMDSYDQSVDGIVAVGMHAGAGNEAGFLSHTYTIEDVQYKVNGIPFNESMILAMGGARYRIPLIMVSGDDQLGLEVKRFLPWAKYAVVKKALGRSKAEPLPREEVSRRITEAARGALSALETMRFPECASPPFRFALTFQDEQQAQAVAWLPGTETTPDPATIQIRTSDFEDGYRKSLGMIRAAGLVSRVQVLQRVVNTQPNSQTINQQIGQYVDDRWLNVLPPSKPAATAAPQRYWGAR